MPERKRRLIRDGDIYHKGEDVEFEIPEPNPEPDDGGTERWARLTDIGRDRHENDAGKSG
jgi:hypothetical protein